ncbi:unnamed protein product [Paramecium octaurelia]|uniref:Transmembrane protein n=1 Tax=Paramecium octaurelia TaxID=43137 RepID=A0A8S1YM20_PAROT|nr:unnamed protein product [Paramecium octaurelia]
MFMNIIFLGLAIPAFQIQQQQFLDQEKIKLGSLFYQMAINNKNDEQNFLNLNFQLLQKVQEFDTYTNLYQNYHFLQRNINETLLLVNEKLQLKALLSFNDFPINDKLIVSISDFQIQLPEEDCEKFYFLQDDHLLAVCKENGNYLQIFTLSQQKIIDQKQLKYQFKCEIGFSKIDQVLIIYEKNQIDFENYKLNIQQLSELMTLLVEVQSDLPQKLIQLEICQIDEFYIAFQKTLFYYSVQVKILCVIYRAEGQHLEIYELLNCCKSLQFTLINKDTGTLKFKSKFIISTQGYKQSYINNYFLLHHFDDKVVVQLNEQLHLFAFRIFQIFSDF